MYSITVVPEAAVDAMLTVPPVVLPSETLTVAFAVANPTGVGALAVQPSLVLSGTAAASMVLASAPTASDIPAGQTVTFPWAYTPGSPGALHLGASASVRMARLRAEFISARWASSRGSLPAPFSLNR